ncbi:50S ribosomal protein L10 [Planctomycetota bacterium]
MPSRLKTLMVEEYSHQLNSMGDMFAVCYTGLKVAENNELRTELNKSGNFLMHVRNRIFKIALQNAGLDDFAEFVEGPTGIVFGEDIINGIKIINKYAKKNKGIDVRGGYFEGRILTPAEVMELSQIPSREILISQVMTVIQAPVAGVASVLQALVRKLVLTVKEIEKTK